MRSSSFNTRIVSKKSFPRIYGRKFWRYCISRPSRWHGWKTWNLLSPIPNIPAYVTCTRHLWESSFIERYNSRDSRMRLDCWEVFTLDFQDSWATFQNFKVIRWRFCLKSRHVVYSFPLATHPYITVPYLSVPCLWYIYCSSPTSMSLPGSLLIVETITVWAEVSRCQDFLWRVRDFPLAFDRPFSHGSWWAIEIG